MTNATQDFRPDLAKELAGTTESVSHLYGFLAGLFLSELSEEGLASLRAPEMRAMLEGAGVQLEGDFWTRPSKELLEQLAVEYTALFLGPGGHISPHESVQIEAQGGYWGEATVAVRKFIIDAGIEYRADFKGVPDHLSVELEFMSELARRESQAWQAMNLDSARNSLECQLAFLEDHLGRWIGDFCAKVVETAELPFYREFAQLTQRFISSEMDDIAQRLIR